MEKETKLLNIKKATAFKNIPPKVLKSSANSWLETLTNLLKKLLSPYMCGYRKG